MKRPRTALWLAAACVCGLSTGEALAAWTVDGQARLDSRYEDNVLLSADSKDDAIVTSANAQGEVRRVTENSELSALAGVTYLDYSAYSGQEELTNKDIEFGDVRGEWRGDRVTWRLRGSGRRDVMLETVGVIRNPLDAQGAGLAAPNDGTGTIDSTGAGTDIDQGVSTGSTVDQGSVEQQIRRYDVGVNPSVEYRVTERTSTTLGYGYQTLDYHNGTQAGLEDSETNFVSLEVRHDLSEVSAVRLSTRAAQFEPENGSSTDAYGATVGWLHRFSETAGGSIDVGANQSDQNGETNYGLSLSVRGYRNTESGNLYFQAQRSLMPSGFGALLETDRLLFGYRRSLSDTVHLTLRADAYQTDSTNGSSNNNDRKYASFGPELRWAFSPSFSLGATYRFTWVDRESDSGSAQDNAVGIFISYQPQREI